MCKNHNDTIDDKLRNILKSLDDLKSQNEGYLTSFINYKFKKQIKNQTDFIYNTASMINNTCMGLVAQTKATNDTLKLISEQVARVDDSDNESEGGYGDK